MSVKHGKKAPGLEFQLFSGPDPKKSLTVAPYTHRTARAACL
jgi:hypothetical protein